MKRFWKVAVVILIILIIGTIWFVMTPTDIRPDYLGDKVTKEDSIKGQELLLEMQGAYGGKDHWLAFKIGSYAQTADWYDNKLGVAGWDTLPQQFEMISTLGTDDCEFTLLNGENRGQTWGVADWKSYQVLDNGEQSFQENEKYQHKLIYKNYWFQFPFRIGEAPIISYAGEAEVEGKTYDLLYATWGSVDANREYDQFVLYVDKKTRLVEWLHFTLREKVKFIHITAHFTDFKTVNGITLPFSQYLTIGSPNNVLMKMHENHYQWIQFGEERVER